MKCTNDFAQNPFSLEGRKILVTGASSGIGKAIATTASRFGAHVALLARSCEKLDETMKELEGTGHKSLSLDLFAEDSVVELALADFAEDWGNPDGFVHSAGVFAISPLRGVTKEEAERIFHVNHYVFLSLSRILAKGKKPVLKSAVAIASAAGIKGNAGLSLYSASKSALISSVRCLALEYASKNVRFNCICPGWVDTPMLKTAKMTFGDESFEKNIIEAHPLGLGNPEDVANAAVYLLSDASRWITGSSLVVDGGYSL